MSAAAPAELAALGELLAPLADLRSIGALTFWDQNTMMPPRGAAARADAAATLERIAHEHQTDPEVGRLLDALEGWVRSADADSEEVRLIAQARRDFEKAVRVPADLAAEMSHASALGQQAWMQARAESDFRLFRDALARQIDLRHRYVACFDGFEHAYDVLLDDFEPELTTEELQPLLADLREALVPLVAKYADPDRVPYEGLFAGPWEPDVQHGAIMDVLEVVGFERDGWRLDAAPHPFAQGLDPTDVRITTRYDRHDFGTAFYAAMHEFGHGLYEAQIPRRLVRTPLGKPVSLGVHESQSRMWENFVGRGRPFCSWVAPRLSRTLPGLGEIDGKRLFRAVNGVSPSLIRVEADETTYNLHIILRFELELGMIDGGLRRRRSSGRLERGDPQVPRHRGDRRRPRRAPGHPLGRRAGRLLPDLHARQPDGRPAVGARRGGHAGARRGDRGRELRVAARVAARRGPRVGRRAAAARAARARDGPGALDRAVHAVSERQARRRTRDVLATCPGTFRTTE